MRIEFSPQEVGVLVQALNLAPVRGEDNMIAALTLIQKLKRAWQEEQDVQKREPADGGHPVSKEG